MGSLTNWLGLLAGGLLGTLARYLMVASVSARMGTVFPYGTLSVNLLGCFIIGLLAGLPEGVGTLSPTLRLTLITGLLGAFTTFSAFELDTFLLAREGVMTRALLYVAVSVGVGMLALLAGFGVMRGLLGRAL